MWEASPNESLKCRVNPVLLVSACNFNGGSRLRRLASNRQKNLDAICESRLLVGFLPQS
jgi:hypothetical protein